MRDMDLLIKRYLDYCAFAKALDAKTTKAYRIDLVQFSEALSETCDALCRESIAAYIAKLHQKYKPKTVKRKIASVKAFLNYLELEQIIETNPIKAMRLKIHEPITLPRTIPSDSIAAILRNAYLLKKSIYEQHAKVRCCRERHCGARNAFCDRNESFGALQFKVRKRKLA